jgi:glycerol-3-phosphate dehydrogenase (NAD(P)+)
MNIERIGIIGGGAWGTALAQVAATGGRETLLWARELEVVASINSRHENSVFLPAIPLSPAIRATSDIADLTTCDAWLVVTPAQHMRAVLASAPCNKRPLVLCAKGIEEGTGDLLHTVARAICPNTAIAVLSGPTFAHEVAAGLPTAVTLACEDEALGAALRARLSLPTFRTYATDDVAGAEVGGAVKNVLAIACGVVEGRGLGQNARAALIARGFAEMTRFGLAMGARRETLAGLSGFAQLFARQGPRRRARRVRSNGRSPHRRRRRLHRPRPRPTGEGKGHRHADRRRRRRATFRCGRSRRSPRRPPRAPGTAGAPLSHKIRSSRAKSRDLAKRTRHVSRLRSTQRGEVNLPRP